MRILLAALLAAIPVIVSAQAAPDSAKPDKPAKKVMNSTSNITPAAPVESPVAAEQTSSSTPGVATASLDKVNEVAGVVDNAQASAAQATEDATIKAGDKAKSAVEKKLKKLDKLFGK